MDELKLKEIVEAASAKFLNKDIIGKYGVIINGNSTDKNDFVMYTSRKGYDDLMNEVYKQLKYEIN